MPGKQPAPATPSSRLDGDPDEVGSAAPAHPLVAARVAPGRTVHVGEQRFGPGEAVRLWAEDLARLGALGFVLAGDEPDLAPSPGEPPAGATVQVQDGAQVVPG